VKEAAAGQKSCMGLGQSWHVVLRDPVAGDRATMKTTSTIAVAAAGYANHIVLLNDVSVKVSSARSLSFV
jgi:hypothetical protein